MFLGIYEDFLFFNEDFLSTQSSESIQQLLWGLFVHSEEHSNYNQRTCLLSLFGSLYPCTETVSIINGGTIWITIYTDHIKLYYNIFFGFWDLFVHSYLCTETVSFIMRRNNMNYDLYWSSYTTYIFWFLGPFCLFWVDLRQSLAYLLSYLTELWFF